VKNAFAWDGSLRDIYVLDTNVQSWNHLLNEFRKPHYRPKCVKWSDEEGNEIPDFESTKE
jgi:hypothetical protein